MSANAYTLLGLTAVVAGLVAILVFAVLRFGAAARRARTAVGDTRSEMAFLSSALEDAIGKLRAQERATAARAEASERLSAEIVASLTSGLLVVDRDRRVQIVNPAAQRILRLEENVVGTGHTTALARASALAAVITESLTTNEPIRRRTITIDMPAGSDADTPPGPMRLGVTVSPLGGPGLSERSEPTGAGVICLFTDLTNVVALEEQLRLKEALARLGELTAGIAHEFRNGLATIHGYGRLLDPALLPEQYGAYVAGIRNETQALGEIVTNFLNFARPAPLTLAPLDLRSVVARALEDVPSATVALEGEFGMIDGDEVLLRQAFSNLFRNSVEACTASGLTPTISVTARTDAAGGSVHLEVRDNGPGIPPEAVHQIFRPFFTTRPAGTGLGLAIVQKVIVSHNGRISAGNAPDGGAVFRLSLPLHEAAHAPKP
jgi:two-component system, NtrC family, sensor histidine kinase AtoS